MQGLAGVFGRAFCGAEVIERVAIVGDVLG